MRRASPHNLIRPGPRAVATPTITLCLCARRARLATGLAVAAALLASAAGATVHTYDNTDAATIPFISTTAGDNPLVECVEPAPGVSPLVRTFTVGDSFTIAEASLGVTISHVTRTVTLGVLESPAGTRAVVFNDMFDSNDNYDVMFVGNGENTGLNDGDADATAAPLYHRDIDSDGLNGFIGESSAGTWTLYLCDHSGSSPGTFLSGRLVLASADTETLSPVCSGTASYDFGANGHEVSFTSASFQDVTLTQVSTTDVFGNALTPEANFVTRTSTQGADVGYYAMGFTADPGDNPLDADADESGAMIAVFSFDPPVRDLQFELLDVDFVSTGWEDIVRARFEDPAGNILPFDGTSVDAAFTGRVGGPLRGRRLGGHRRRLGQRSLFRRRAGGADDGRVLHRRLARRPEHSGHRHRRRERLCL